ncbi:MAG: bifunctional tetrahydrofolate synthase/dihydrofolate synthase [Polaromonas sp.]|uniref:bifunctional tetrahydrofolate synthase/dihydrofolate synthase n=1 Tax=Polaromonas sp. TaxID=1869339 RepID=UPI0024895B50|nr:bifunctional tetrahydrofolate synthase/dihydrofolate synthase [Polaromonas sp.]MDI1268845.1 bifunctional tetrahydrofolate synthase/dihydrofolate synthase [Polaromonas sp.]
MDKPTTLADWLAHCERLHPNAIDLGLERVRSVAERMALRFDCPVITVAGTNGKGSSCAMLEAILGQAGYRTGVYTSPHLVHFEERCRIRGEMASADQLLPHFERVEALRGDTSLTYFEFTMLAIFSLMAEAGLDVVILEVGVGGRLDSVNIIDADCALITSIDIDHTELLGKDRESIGREKAGIMRAGKPAVVGDPVPPQSVIARAAEVGADLWRLGHDFNFSGDKQQWAWAGRGRRYAGLAYPALRGANQLVNASGVLAALTALRDRLPVTAQAVRNGLGMVELPGRFQIISGQPTLVLDVAHNPHAVAALTENLDAMGFYPCTHGVFGAMADKDLAQMLTRVGPLVDRWYFTDLPTPRAARADDLLARWQALNTRQDARAGVYADPVQALQAAVAAADPTDRIVVFGSFYTVGGVLKDGLPRLFAPHAAPERHASSTDT